LHGNGVVSANGDSADSDAARNSWFHRALSTQAATKHFRAMRGTEHLGGNNGIDPLVIIEY
jgi:hypothetical protein